MKNVKPLTDLEMHELLHLIYPEHIRSDADEYFDLSSEMVDYPIDLGDGFEVTLAELLARVCMCAIPMRSALSGEFSHCLGKIKIKDGEAHMLAAVRRPVEVKK